MDLAKLVAYLAKVRSSSSSKRTSQKIEEDDVKRAVKSSKCSAMGYALCK